MTSPSVTALIDTYNHERFIEQAITSVFDQGFPASEMEILVVDDGSTDRTPDIVREFEPRVRLIRKSNGGQASVFNVGIAQARGQIVAFLDADDWWAPPKLTKSQKFSRATLISVPWATVIMNSTQTPRPPMWSCRSERADWQFGTPAALAASTA